MIGISISLYDRFDDLNVLMDIIRNNWEDEYFISVCSNHPEASDRFDEIDHEPDDTDQGAQINLDDSMDDFRYETNFVWRVYDTIKRACGAALAVDEVDYVMHIHADAWPLDEDSFKSLINEVSDHDACFAFKSERGFCHDAWPPGRFMDQYTIYDAEAAQAVNLFKNDPVDFPPQCSIHGILPILCIAKFGWNNIYRYSTRVEEVYWDGEPVRREDPRLRRGRVPRPMMYNPEHDQVHIATNDYPEGIGKALQAYYLDRYDLTEGPYIEQLQDEFGMPKQKLFATLADHNEKKNEKLSFWNLTIDNFDRDIDEINEFHTKPLSEKVRISVEQNIDADSALYHALKAGNAGLQSISTIISGKQQAKLEEQLDQVNQSYREVCTDQLEPEDYPTELANRLFEDTKNY